MQNFWKELQKPFSVLAPMEDVTDIAFRQLVEECGRPDVFFTEFTNVDGMASAGREAVIQRLEKRDSEHPIVAQIWGTNPENYFKAAKDVVEMGFDGVDINMGCPVKKIVKNVTCSALIDKPEKAKEIIQATKEGVNGKIPVSVKTRCGFKTWKTEEWVTFLLEQNVDVITLHARIAKEMSKNPAEWDEIGKAVELRDKMAVDTLIIGNGDVESLAEIKEKHEKYGVDGVMIGRGVFKDPFVFNPQKSINDLTVDERKKLVLRHVELFEKYHGTTRNFAVLRRFFKIYIKDFDGASELRDKLMHTNNGDEVRVILKK